eukprot:SAG11_NODE_4775_length_1770_cov_2.196888_1_plen_271_part_00
MSRPEHTAPPELFYNDVEASKYTQNSRMIQIQRTMSERAIELLALPEGTSLLLCDIGCGSGLSGEVLEESGHNWIGCDISSPMLSIAVQRDNEGDVFCLDIGTGLPFRPGTLDGAISISAIQWLCNADKRSHVPQKRLALFFSSLYRGTSACPPARALRPLRSPPLFRSIQPSLSCTALQTELLRMHSSHQLLWSRQLVALARGARAVLQFYPESAAQMELITTAAMKAVRLFSSPKTHAHKTDSTAHTTHVPHTHHTHTAHTHTPSPFI